MRETLTWVSTYRSTEELDQAVDWELLERYSAIYDQKKARTLKNNFKMTEIERLSLIPSVKCWTYPNHRDRLLWKQKATLNPAIAVRHCWHCRKEELPFTINHRPSRAEQAFPRPQDLKIRVLSPVTSLNYCLAALFVELSRSLNRFYFYLLNKLYLWWLCAICNLQFPFVFRSQSSLHIYGFHCHDMFYCWYLSQIIFPHV